MHSWFFRALRLGGVLTSPQTAPSGLQMTPPSVPGTEKPGMPCSPDFFLYPILALMTNLGNLRVRKTYTLLRARSINRNVTYVKRGDHWIYNYARNGTDGTSTYSTSHYTRMIDLTCRTYLLNAYTTSSAISLSEGTEE